MLILRANYSFVPIDLNLFNVWEVTVIFFS